MSRMGVTNLGPVEVSSPVARRRFLDLNKEVVECTVGPRLVESRGSVARVKKRQFLDWNYWGRPVPGFGDISATIVLIGLAPAPHGGNRTGRVFTGDGSADFLVRALFKAGYANQPRSVDVNDGLELHGVYMTAAVKCVPPDNKPTSEEMSNCAHFLKSELELCKGSRVILCLGQFAYRSTMILLKQYNLFLSKIPMFAQRFDFFLGQVEPLSGLKLVLLSFFDLLENDFPVEIDIFACRVMEKSLSLT